ncbi:EthD domain-containing protein [Acinetobacter indicus]|uniref:EthD domain-containing protein n=1 Tax=Acinetobacter indicus TaxID=756892 RepID=UPI000CEB98EF|nr:EthD domain-containing protein [Acinetobacter indicus]
MIKRMGLFQRRNDLTPTQFSAYWAKKHSPLVMGMSGFQRYIQNHRLDFLPNFTASHPSFDLDGIAEMYWNTEQEMQSDFSSQQGIEVLRQDETEFMSHISVCIVDEGPLFGYKASVKLVLCLSEGYRELNETVLKQALPHIRGIQSSQVKEVIQRPQLPQIPYIPQQFFSLWFDQYDHVLQDFQNIGWMNLYQYHLMQIERVVLMLSYAFVIRNK